jgi:hypothetical protein
MGTKRVVVVVNKWWECDPVINVLLHPDARPEQELDWPDILNHPRRQPPKEAKPPVPRAVYKRANTNIEFWCVSDFLEPFGKDYQSSSQYKADQLPKLFETQPADLVIAVGTAAYPDPETSRNGSVVVGTRVFMHNCHPVATDPNPFSKWEAGPFDELRESSLKMEDFTAITAMDSARKASVLSRFMLVPTVNEHTDVRDILVDYDGIAIGALNVTDYHEYDVTDRKTLGAFWTYCPGKQAVSLETTHGLIRVIGGEQFMFISGITDRFGHFHEEVDPRKYAQNMCAAHNAGVALAWMLPKIVARYNV